MAEILGVVSGAAGLTSLAISIGSGAIRLHDLYKESKTVSHQIGFLIKDLEFLVVLIKALDQLDKEKSDDFSVIMGHCRNDIENIASTLTAMTEKFHSISPASTKTVTKMLRLSANRKELDQLKDFIKNAKLNIMLALSYGHVHVTSSVPASLPQTLMAQPLVVDKDETQVYSSQLQMMNQHSHSMSKPSVTLLQRRYHRHANCNRRTCSCTCHRRGHITSRFWDFEYTPLSMILSPCSNSQCNARRYKSEIRVALTQLGWPWAVTVGLEMNCSFGTYSLKPSLQVKEHVVRYTSRGFRLIMELKEGLSDWRSVVTEFREMYQQDERMILHVNPAGHGYIEDLLRYPVWGTRIDSVLKVLKLFMAEFEMQTGLERTSFLYRIARWIGEGPHLAVLEELLALGFDPGNLEVPLVESWPQPCDPNWISEKATPDPFFIQYLAMMVSVDSEFGETSPLQREILCGSVESVLELLDPGCLDLKTNFLGQTALHLAVREGELVTSLISAGFPVNVSDRNGTTPLMYAAAMGNLEVAKFLVSNGADITTVDKLRGRDFLDYAMARGNSRLATEVTLHIQDLYPEHAAPLGVDYAKRILLYLVSGTGYDSGGYGFDTVLKLVGDLNFTFSDHTDNTHSNNLMHYSWGLTHADILTAHGFTAFDHRNSEGITPLMVCIKRHLINEMRILIGKGANVNEQDLDGRTPLQYALVARAAVSRTSQNKDDIDCVRELLQAGAEAELNDFCGCPCSPSGCSATNAMGAYFSHQSTFSATDLLETVEWLCVLEEAGSMDSLKSSLLSLIRRARFDEMELKHICCSRGKPDHDPISRSFGNTFSKEDKAKIVWEQNELVRQLEDQLSCLQSKSCKELREVWLLQIREMHHAYLRRNNFPNWQEILHLTTKRKAVPQAKKNPMLYSINFREDQFDFPPLVLARDHDFSQNPIHQIVSFVWTLEEGFSLRSITTRDSSSIDEWYNRRLLWVLELAGWMGISHDLIEEKLREYGLRNLEIKDKTMISVYIGHFLQSYNHSI
ncbi:hypothetical protein SUNI508_13281 [Seiridium unicorne]|uniref:Uncharacterized protein n=1 Tax=Seiridium unicorne TaxID=138068 RepID=A0ABR2VDE8_9PEZI